MIKNNIRCVRGSTTIDRLDNELLKLINLLLSVFFNITTKMLCKTYKNCIQKYLFEKQIFVQKIDYPLKILLNFLLLLQKAVAAFLLSRILLCDKTIPPINETTARSSHVTGFG